jgi:hypothetical protein
VAEFAYNNQVHSWTQQVPFMTDTGRLPRMGFEPNGMRSADESVNKFRDWIAAGVSEAKAVLVKAKDEFKLYYDRRCVPTLEIKVGDRVWVDASNIKMMRLSPKFSDKWLGPFKVVQVVGKGCTSSSSPHATPTPPDLPGGEARACEARPVPRTPLE